MSKKEKEELSEKVPEQESGFIKRLEQIIGEESVRSFARRVGVADTTLRQYLNGRSEPTLSKLTAIAQGSGCSVSWLATGEGPVTAETPGSFEQQQREDMLRAVLDNDAEAEARVEERARPRIQEIVARVKCLKAALASLPTPQAQLWEARLYEAVADGKASPDDLDALLGLFRKFSTAEPGVIWVPVHPLQQGDGRYPHPYNRKVLFRRELDPARLATCYSPGNAMEPTLRETDPLLVNLASTTPLDGGLFMVQLGDDLYAKRIQRLVDGGLVLISDNREYQPQTISADHVDDLPIIGQVVSINKAV